MCVVEGILIVVHLILATMTAERMNIHKGNFEENWKTLFTEKSLKIKAIEESVSAVLSFCSKSSLNAAALPRLKIVFIRSLGRT
jgi:hypothetical protein